MSAKKDENKQESWCVYAQNIGTCCSGKYKHSNGLNGYTRKITSN